MRQASEKRLSSAFATLILFAGTAVAVGDSYCRADEADCAPRTKTNCFCRWWADAAPPNSPIAESMAVMRVQAPVLSSQMVVQRQLSQETLQIAPLQSQSFNPAPSVPAQQAFTYRVNIVPPAQAPAAPAAPATPVAPEKTCCADPATAAQMARVAAQLDAVSKTLSDLTIIVSSQNDRLKKLEQ